MIELNSFVGHLSGLCPDFRNRKYLLAISGGIDSMVMLHLFQSAGLNCAIAHVNFQLRGSESERDMNFVFDAARTAGYRIFEQRYDTKDFAQKNRMNIQEAARKLRYGFFRETAANNGFQYTSRKGGVARMGKITVVSRNLIIVHGCMVDYDQTPREAMEGLPYNIPDVANYPQHPVG